MTVLFTGPSPRDASAYMRITQGESSPWLDPEIPEPLIPKGCIPRMISIWGSPSQAHQDHQGHQGHGGQANGGAAEIRVCGMKNVTTDKMASNPCELLSEKSKHFQKLLPRTQLGRDFSELSSSSNLSDHLDYEKEVESHVNQHLNIYFDILLG